MISKDIIFSRFLLFLSILISFMVVTVNAGADYQTSLVYQGYIQDSSGDIDVESYSVPVVYDWNSDGAKDLLVGKLTLLGEGHVVYFENQGTNAAPSFGSGTYIQSCAPVCSPLYFDGTDT